MSARPDLKLVEPAPLRRLRPASPETRLRRLLRKEARLEGELIEARQAIGAARADYARKHGLLMWPSLDTVRRLFR